MLRSRAEEAVRPLLGQRPRLAEHDRHVRVAHLQLGEAVGDDPGRTRVSLKIDE